MRYVVTLSEAALLATALELAPCAAAADGAELFGIGAVQTAMGGAGVASPQDATWALLNPAGLVDLDARLDLSIELLYNRLWAEPRGWSAVVNPHAGDMRIDNLLPIPSGGIAWPLSRGTFGTGVFGLQGNVSEFPRPRTSLSLLDNADRRSDYGVARLPLAYGYQFDNGWAIGGALVGAVSAFRMDSITLTLRPTRGSHEWDIALGAGFALGIYKRWDQWSVGAAYSSRVWMQDYHRYKADVVRWNFDQPQKLQAGIAYRPVDRLELVVDYKWIEWSATKLLGNPPIRGGLGWRDQHIVKAGLAWHVSNRWTMRTGLSWGKAPIRPHVAFANGLTPALAELHVALGVSYQIRPHAALHVAAAYAPRRAITDNGRGDIISILGRGSIIAYQENALVVQYSWQF